MLFHKEHRDMEAGARFKESTLRKCVHNIYPGDAGICGVNQGKLVQMGLDIAIQAGSDAPRSFLVLQAGGHID